MPNRYDVVSTTETPPDWPPPRRTINDAIKSIADRNHQLGTVIDIGASNGMWSRLFMDQYPSAEYLLIEAQSIHKQALMEFCSQYQNAQFVLAAAGQTAGVINFLADSPFGGKASNTPFDSDNIVVPVTTVDAEVRARGLEDPFLIKLDTHGFEVPILVGAEETLRSTAVIVIECYNFKISPECLLFYEMCLHLESMGFRCIDLVDPLYRPLDNALWQMDLVFVRSDRPEFKFINYE